MADEMDGGQIPEVRDLYRLDRDEFVAARAALAKQLRSDGRKDEAKVVAKLRKPSVTSWALDQVAVDQPDLLADALAAGEALRAATTATLEGDASNLRVATDAEGKAVAAVIDAAGAHLPALTADHRERMIATLRAAAADDEVRAQLEAGLLATDHEPPAMGFGAAASRPAVAAPTAAKTPASEEPKRKIRRVGSPSSAKRATVDEVDAKRRAKEVERLHAEEAERKRAKAALAEERKRQQAALDAAAVEARTRADELAEQARTAEEAAAATRLEADRAATAAVEAEQAAQAGPPGSE